MWSNSPLGSDGVAGGDGASSSNLGYNYNPEKVSFGNGNLGTANLAENSPYSDSARYLASGNLLSDAARFYSNRILDPQCASNTEYVGIPDCDVYKSNQEPQLSTLFSERKTVVKREIPHANNTSTGSTCLKSSLYNSEVKANFRQNTPSTCNSSVPLGNQGNYNVTSDYNYEPPSKTLKSDFGEVRKFNERLLDDNNVNFGQLSEFIHHQVREAVRNERECCQTLDEQTVKERRTVQPTSDSYFSSSSGSLSESSYSDKSRRSRVRRKARTRVENEDDSNKLERYLLKDWGFDRKSFAERDQQLASVRDVTSLPAIPQSQFLVSSSSQDIEPFSGIYVDYLDFKSTFLASVQSFPEGQRLHLLKLKLDDVGRGIIAGCHGHSNGTFMRAFRLLDNHFNNPELICQILINDIRTLLNPDFANDEEKFINMIPKIRKNFNRIHLVQPIKVLGLDGMITEFMSTLPYKLYEVASYKRMTSDNDFNFAKILIMAEDHVRLRLSQKVCPETRPIDDGKICYKCATVSKDLVSNVSRGTSCRDDRQGHYVHYFGGDQSSDRYGEDQVKFPSGPEHSREVITKIREPSLDNEAEKLVKSVCDKSCQCGDDGDLVREQPKENPRYQSVGKAESSSAVQQQSRDLLYDCNLCQSNEHATVDCPAHYEKDHLQQMISERFLCLACGAVGHKSSRCPIVKDQPDAQFLCKKTEGCKQVPHCTKFCLVLRKD